MSRRRQDVFSPLSIRGALEGGLKPTLREASRFAVARTRAAIDRVDDGLLVLLAARRRLVGVVARLKPRAGIPSRDPRREHAVRQRAQAMAQRLGVPSATATRLLDLAIGDACTQQGLAVDLDQSGPDGAPVILDGMNLDLARAAPMLRLLPPPRHLAPLLRVVPARWQHALLERAMARVLAAPLAEHALDFMAGRRLGIEVTDLKLRWVLTLCEGRLVVIDDTPEASVRGSATDLLLLASRLEDADTLFFQRTLVLTGDTELGLTARNLLDRLPWESVPLGLRIALNRGARLARAARDEHHA
ncbi:ubiquinone anaerobic biosynthesis accessory factor UbiT [Frateuria sp.]|uniref:ubiquinone anaerobic biosynthesis accessory factor UbiT n=1 Tax=Frateuria sp. TaxID=2211372 RepID=UPI003F7DB94A